MTQPHQRIATDKGLAPTRNMLTTVTDADLLTVVRVMFPYAGEAVLRTAIKMFRNSCDKHNVTLLKATPDDYATITQRQAIGWSDDRP